MSPLPEIVGRFYRGPLDGHTEWRKEFPAGEIITVNVLPGPLLSHIYKSCDGGFTWWYFGTEPTPQNEIEAFVSLTDEYFAFVEYEQ